jgi:eukaryotic-like serine/threonine-protein kinase
MESSAANNADHDGNRHPMNRDSQSPANSGQASDGEDSTEQCSDLALEDTRSFDERDPASLHADAPEANDDTPRADVSTPQPDAAPDTESSLGLALGSQASTLPPWDRRETRTDRQPGKFGKYELLERIGQGGMGLVYKARQQSPNRLVAIKMILAGRFASDHDVKRFQNESEAAAELDHPHIVPIYEVGEHEGYNYFSMKLIEGSSVQASKEPYVADPKRAAKLVATVARAIHHAHQRGVLHRDLKPSNILIDTHGTPFIVDFGLAKRLHSTLELTQGDVKLGTPRYMAPEQVARAHGAVTTATDIYGLGTVLYFLVTGISPVQGISAGEVLEQVLHQIPEPLSRLNPRVERDLETICLKCLEKQPSQRYASAEELAADLDRWLAGKPIKARPVGLFGRTSRWCRRHPAEAILGSLAVGAMLFIVAMAGWLAVDGARRDAEVERKVTLEWDTAIQALSAGQSTRANEAFGRATGLASTASPAAQRHIAPRLADLQTLFRLDDIRMSHLEASEDGLDLAGAAALYAAAFRDYGIDVEHGLPAEVGAQIKKREASGALVEALDDWALNATGNAARERLLAVAAAAEGQPDSVNNKVRAALARRDKSALLDLAKEFRSTRLRPATLVSLAAGLREQGALQQAVELLTTAQQDEPGDFWLNLELATTMMLSRPSELRDAQPFITAALALSNGNPGVYTYVGQAQVKAGRLADAEKSYSQAVSRKNDFAVAVADLGLVLNEQGKLKEAEAVLRRAVALDPGNARAYYNLGLNLQRQGNNRGALEAYQQSLTLKPDFAEAFNNYGNTLTALGSFDEALAAFDKALAFRPRYARAHYNRGCLFDQLRRFDEAKDSYRKALECQPEFAIPHYQIAHDLVYEEGRFQDALAELDQGMKLISPNDPTKPKWNRLQAECRRLIKLDPRLDLYLKGEIKPAGAGEACELALLCAWPSRRLFGEAARLYEQAFAAEPKREIDLRFGYRYYAAGCAARASSGKGRDSHTADERAHWRERALNWLQADLSIRREQIRHGTPGQAKDARTKLLFWLSDPHLVDVRERQSLEEMTEPQRHAWRELWQSVRELVDQPNVAPEKR